MKRIGLPSPVSNLSCFVFKSGRPSRPSACPPFRAPKFSCRLIWPPFDRRLFPTATFPVPDSCSPRPPCPRSVSDTLAGSPKIENKNLEFIQVLLNFYETHCWVANGFSKNFSFLPLFSFFLRGFFYFISFPIQLYFSMETSWVWKNRLTSSIPVIRVSS